MELFLNADKLIMKKIFLVLTCIAVLMTSAFCNTLYKTGVVASYYAEDFHGKKTSNGEVFNMWGMTCAHKMLPFNTMLKVTNLSNGKSVVVRVNDRGPFVANREIDLSKGAASKISMIGSGTAKVKLEIISLGVYTKASVVTAKKACLRAGIKYVQIKIPKTGKDATVAENSKAIEKIESIKKIKRAEGALWDIQVGAFSKRENALNFARKLKSTGFENVILQKNETVLRVSLKAVPSEDVNAVVDKLVEKGYNDLVVRLRKSN